jgi:hypothetical protein
LPVSSRRWRTFPSAHETSGAAGDGLANLDHQLYHHHHGEETIFWPALRELGADESLVGDLGGEHERLAEAMKLTRNAMSALASDPTEANVDQARAAFDTLGDVVDTHFTHEERDLEPMLAGVIASPEWNRAQAQIRKTQGPAATGVMVAGCLTTLIRMPGRSYAMRFRDRRCSYCPMCSVALIRKSPRCGSD